MGNVILMYELKEDGQTVQKFLEYSTISDAPVSKALMLDNFKVYYLNKYGTNSKLEFNERIERAVESGSSAWGESFESTILTNRAGDNEACLSPEQFIERFFLTKPTDPAKEGPEKKFDVQQMIAEMNELQKASSKHRTGPWEVLECHGRQYVKDLKGDFVGEFGNESSEDFAVFLHNNAPAIIDYLLAENAELKRQRKLSNEQIKVAVQALSGVNE